MFVFPFDDLLFCSCLCIICLLIMLIIIKRVNLYTPLFWRACSTRFLATVISKPIIATVLASPTRVLFTKGLSSRVWIPAGFAIVAPTPAALIPHFCKKWGGQAYLVVVVIHAVTNSVILILILDVVWEACNCVGVHQLGIKVCHDRSLPMRHSAVWHWCRTLH